MKKILLASAGVMVMSAGVGYAACIPTPSCSSLPVSRHRAVRV